MSLANFLQLLPPSNRINYRIPRPQNQRAGAFSGPIRQNYGTRIPMQRGQGLRQREEFGDFNTVQTGPLIAPGQPGHPLGPARANNLYGQHMFPPRLAGMFSQEQPMGQGTYTQGPGPPMQASYAVQQSPQGTQQPGNQGSPTEPAQPGEGSADPWWSNYQANKRAQGTLYPGVQDNSWQSDPDYQAMLNLINNQTLPGAASGYLQALQQNLLGFGSQELAHSYLDKALPSIQKYLGHKVDLTDFYKQLSPEAGITENQNTTLGNLLHQYKQNIYNTRENMNKENLFWSGARLKEEGEVQRDRLSQEATARQNLASQLGEYGGAYNTSVQNALFQIAQAAAEARQRREDEEKGADSGGTQDPVDEDKAASGGKTKVKARKTTPIYMQSHNYASQHMRKPVKKKAKPLRYGPWR